MIPGQSEVSIYRTIGRDVTCRNLRPIFLPSRRKNAIIHFKNSLQKIQKIQFKNLTVEIELFLI